MNEKSIKNIFEILKKKDPEPITELNYKTTFQLLIAVILSAQATDKSVNSATSKLFKIAGTPKKMTIILSPASLTCSFPLKFPSSLRKKPTNIPRPHTPIDIFDRFENRSRFFFSFSRVCICSGCLLSNTQHV